jgi:hypothetical protein
MIRKAIPSCLQRFLDRFDHFFARRFCGSSEVIDELPIFTDQELMEIPVFANPL